MIDSTKIKNPLFRKERFEKGFFDKRQLSLQIRACQESIKDDNYFIPSIFDMAVFFIINKGSIKWNYFQQYKENIESGCL